MSVKKSSVADVCATAASDCKIVRVAVAVASKITSVSICQNLKVVAAALRLFIVS